MRRPHVKSRLGCHTCKRRKVKCDEVKPQCGNCCRFGIDCDFAPLPLHPRPENQHQHHETKLARRGRPRSDWASWAEQIRVSSQTAAAARATGTSGLNVADIQVYHHYLASTALTVEPNADTGLWREGVPQLGFQYPCILDLVLSLSAYHMARKWPAEAVKYHAVAEQHSTAALQAATVLLRQMSAENAQPLYIISVLVCFTSLAKGPCPGDLFLVADDGQVPWLSLLRGVKLVVQSAGWSAIFSGPLAEYHPNSEPEDSEDGGMEEKSEEETMTQEDWRMSLRRAAAFIELGESNEFNAEYRRELDALEESYEATFGKGEHAAVEAVGRMQTVMGWIYRLDDILVQRLNGRDPIALVVLGHFCALLHTLRREYWFVEGWAQHLIQEILRVNEATQGLLTWPIQFINGG